MNLPKSFEGFVPSDEFTREIEAACNVEKVKEVVYVKSNDVLANKIIPDTVIELVLVEKEIEKPKAIKPVVSYNFDEDVPHSTIVCHYPIGNYLVSRRIPLQVCSLHKNDKICIENGCERAIERQRMFGKKEPEEKPIEEKAKKAQLLFQNRVNPIQGDS
jgi:hypothetical protein